MALLHFGVIVTAAGHVQRMVYPDTDAQLATAANLGPGEILVSVSTGPYPNNAAWYAAVDAAVRAAVGGPPISMRSVVVDGKGNVINAIIADPSVYQIPGFTVVQSDVAQVGWTWNVDTGFHPPALLIARSSARSGGRTSLHLS